METTGKANARVEQWSFETRPAFAPRRVLVVDDYKDIAESLAAVLEIKGFETRVAFDGQQAFALYQLWRPNVVILDISLPDVHGIAIGRQMRAFDQHDAAIVAHTALDVCEIRDEATAAGFDAFVGKPISPSDLAAVIDRVCPDARAWAAQRKLERTRGQSTV